ncbi:MAG: DUF1326 domain-containing protein [Actinomycetota bacterium]
MNPAVVPAWHMRGSLLGACNCDWGCPCNFDAPPTNGHCDGFYAFAVSEGRFGDVVLDGVKFLFGGHSPGPVHEGRGTEILVVDDRATLEQREAIERLWRGGGVGMPFDVFASVTETHLDPVFAPIEVKLDGINSKYVVAGGAVYDLAIEPIKNPVTGEPEEIYVDKPTGFTSLRSEMGTSSRARFRSGDFAFDLTGRYAEYAEFSYSGP